jgi:hypothetical protein
MWKTFTKKSRISLSKASHFSKRKVRKRATLDDDREVLINGDKQDRKRRSRPMENSSPRKRDQGTGYLIFFKLPK